MSGKVADPALGVCRRPEASQQHRAERFPRVPRPRSRASSCSTDSGGRTALGELVVAAGQAPPVLRPVEEPLHDVIERDQLCRVCGRYAEYPALHHIVFESRTAWCCRATSSRSAGSPDRPATVGSRTARKRGCGGEISRHRGMPGHPRRLRPRVRSGAPSPRVRGRCSWTVPCIVMGNDARLGAAPEINSRLRRSSGSAWSLSRGPASGARSLGLR